MKTGRSETSENQCFALRTKGPLHGALHRLRWLSSCPHGTFVADWPEEGFGMWQRCLKSSVSTFIARSTRRVDLTHLHGRKHGVVDLAQFPLSNADTSLWLALQLAWLIRWNLQ
jgi:hypothetical protein